MTQIPQSPFKPGQTLLVKNMETQPLEVNSRKGKFKAMSGGRMVMMYMGTVTPDDIHEFRAEAVLMSIGFGPLLWSQSQRKLLDALKAARAALGGGNSQTELDVMQQIDEALAAVAHFDQVTERVAG